MELINLLYSNQIVFIIFFAALGLIVGSFLNVVIYRLPIMLKNTYKQNCIDYFDQKPQLENKKFNIISPPSHCPKCKTTILWWQNIPVLSYIILKGKCHYCKSEISWQYPTVEILTSIITVTVALYFGDAHIKTFSILILTWSLIAIIFIDFKHQLLPDNITIPLIWFGLLLNSNHIFTSPQNAIIGAISGYLSLWIIAKTFKTIRKMDGMGYGDFKLFAIFGAWLGWQLLPLIILVASIAGTIIGIFWIMTKKYFFTRPLPFGPYLATAGWLSFFWGETILKWYSQYPNFFS